MIEEEIFVKPTKGDITEEYQMSVFYRKGTGFTLNVYACKRKGNCTTIELFSEKNFSYTIQAAKRDSKLKRANLTLKMKKYAVSFINEYLKDKKAACINLIEKIKC